MSNGLQLSIAIMKEVANKKGGRCLSEYYKNNKTKLRWQCANDHKWWARPDMVMRKKNPTWCCVCSGKARIGREVITASADRWGGALYSQTVRGMHHEVLWLCGVGHLFKATPSNVKFGHWCPMCWKARQPETSAKNRREGWARRKEQATGK